MSYLDVIIQMQQWCCSSPAPVISNASSTFFFLKKGHISFQCPEFLTNPGVCTRNESLYYILLHKATICTFNKNICIWIYTRNGCPSNLVGHMLFSLGVHTKDWVWACPGSFQLWNTHLMKKLCRYFCAVCMYTYTLQLQHYICLSIAVCRQSTKLPICQSFWRLGFKQRQIGKLGCVLVHRFSALKGTLISASLSI